MYNILTFLLPGWLFLIFLFHKSYLISLHANPLSCKKRCSQCDFSGKVSNFPPQVFLFLVIYKKVGNNPKKHCYANISSNASGHIFRVVAGIIGCFGSVNIMYPPSSYPAEVDQTQLVCRC